ncbi:type I restriction endonuclease subunit R [Tenacibaculum aestuarii]|uniref:type I restriction endonuclease subunit R n=1 Tax=Tenacibaculum aestuarii TaxID=362781 RepID=UPI0038951AF8
MKFTEAQLEQAIIELLGKENYPHVLGTIIVRDKMEVLIKEDIEEFLSTRYASDNITASEIQSIIRQLENYSSSDLYESNKAIMKLVSDGFTLKREDRSQKDLYIHLLDFNTVENNIFKVVNQLEIEQYHLRIPDAIIYINGLPLVVFEFKTAINESVSIHDAYVQLTTRYKRDIPELFKYNALCVIGDGVNTKAGSFFAPYEFWYAWRSEPDRQKKQQQPSIGIDSLYSLIEGLFDQATLLDVIHNFIYLPDSSKKDEKIVCRYPQYYAVNKLYANIVKQQKPHGNGKGGTYFGATGCGKSFTMLFLARKLMRSTHFASPTIIIITDRTDLDDQLSNQFSNAKGYIGDNNIVSVESRAELREKLEGIKSGGVFLTTIHKFTEDIQLLSERTNIICISDEAHRSQINLEQKLKITEKGVQKTYGFAKYLHDSLPNATYVGFTGTPIDATLDVFGDIVDSYTMTESVTDEITVRLVYEGRAAKVVLDNSEVKKIEEYYDQCVAEGATEYQVEASKKASANMNTIIGDPDRIQAVAEDFVNHYETRVEEGSTVKGKAMFVCSSRPIAYEFYKAVINLRPEWAKIKAFEEGAELTEKEKKEIKPMERIKMIMTRGQDDPEELYNALGTKEYRKELDRQFKNAKSNFKIAIVVDMWLTGFDVPFLDTIYIDKPLQKHNLIQTISRVNRKFQGKNKGLVVDYIGIKKQMNLALAMYNKAESQNFEDIEASVIVVKDHLDLLAKLMHKFDSSLYFNGSAVEQLETLKLASEFVLKSEKQEKRFMSLTKRMKAAYDVCVGSDKLKQKERDWIHFYMAVRSIVFKLTKPNAPDTAQMNTKVREMIKDAIASDGVEEIFKLGEEEESEIDIFNEDYLDRINRIKLPNTKIQILQKLLAKAIDELKKVNKMQGVDFTKKMQAIVERYNERSEQDVFNAEEFEIIAEELTNLILNVKGEFNAGDELGISFEEKAFYDILKTLAHKYDFDYPENRLLYLASEVKKIVDDKTKYTDWSKRDDIKAELKVDLIILLGENDYPPVDRNEVYKEIFEQAENFKKNRIV